MGPGIAQAMRMMAGTFLDHHRDSAARADDRCPRWPSNTCPRMRIDAAVDVQQRHIAVGQDADFRKQIAIAAGIVGVDARDLVGIGRGPGVSEFAASAHADEGRFFRQAVLFGEERVPGVPMLARPERGAGGNVGDVKATLEQLDFRLGLVIPVTAAPGPRVAGSGLLRNDHDAAPLFPWAGSLTPNFSPSGDLKGVMARVCSSITKS